MTAFDPTPLRPDAPAMPHACLTVNGVPLSPGLTSRQHAAIALRVPDSGCEWLDAMIRASLRDSVAAGVLQDAMQNPTGAAFSFDERSAFAYKQADSMLLARGDAL